MCTPTLQVGVPGGVDRFFYLTLLWRCSQSGRDLGRVGGADGKSSCTTNLQDAPWLKLRALPQGILKLESHGKELDEL